MPLWKFRDYWPSAVKCPIADWYAGICVEAQAAFDATWDDLAKTENWDDPEEVPSFKALTEKADHLGLGEVRFYIVTHQPGQKQKKRNFRAIGLWKREAREFIFLTGFEKSGRVTIPPNAMQDAQTMRIALENEEGEIHDHD